MRLNFVMTEAEDKPYVVYKIIEEGKTKYHFEIGSWARGAGFSYQHFVEALAKNPPRSITTITKETPKFAKLKFEKISTEELGKLEQDIETYRTKTLLNP